MDSEYVNLEKNFTIRLAVEEDIPSIIDLFKAVFKSYPSPVFDPEYIYYVMQGKTMFKVIESGGKIVSVASAEMDRLNMNAEVTDCATYPEHRGKGYVTAIIASIENDLREEGFYTLYSLARAIHPNINYAFSTNGYKFGGNLVNNCHICGGFENMNIWTKELRKSRL
jgi:putative beta-lysine N-acetyltransferase